MYMYTNKFVPSTCKHSWGLKFVADMYYVVDKKEVTNFHSKGVSEI